MIRVHDNSKCHTSCNRDSFEIGTGDWGIGEVFGVSLARLLGHSTPEFTDKRQSKKHFTKSSYKFEEVIYLVMDLTFSPDIVG